MKTRYSYLTAVILSLITVCCKRDQVPSPSFIDITATPCNLKSWFFERNIVEYGADGKIEKVSEAVFDNRGGYIPVGYETRSRFQYENGYLRRVLWSTKIYDYTDEPDREEAYTNIKFDYGLLGIEKIYFYSEGIIDHRIDYTYDNFNKPTSMIFYRYQGDPLSDDPYTHRIPRAFFKSEYEYDKNGNIVKEYGTSLIPSDLKSQDYVASFNYDRSANSIKLLETFWLSERSGPWLFSTNNLIDGEYVYLTNNHAPVKVEPTRFDSDNNIIGSKHFFDVKWDCE